MVRRGVYALEKKWAQHTGVGGVGGGGGSERERERERQPVSKHGAERPQKP